MKILINTSNLRRGGGLQVAHSFLNEIKGNKIHEFHVVLSVFLKKQIYIDDFPENFFFYNYSIKPNIYKTITGRDNTLKKLEVAIKPDRVFSIFAPAYWRPISIHIAGFAKPQYIYKDSPFFRVILLKEKIKLKLSEVLHLNDFRNFCDILLAETEEVKASLQKLFPQKEVFTVTNYYNQILDRPELWEKTIPLPKFNGITLLTIASNYPHKNLKIIPEVISYLNIHYSYFKYRFVLCINSEELTIDDESIRNKIVFLGAVKIAQCPYLYEQSDFMFLPTLLECFSASYPEAMKMEKVILTSDLSFARELCGNSAVYFNPLSPKDIADKIVEISMNKKRQEILIDNGREQLKRFDNSAERARKYLNIIEES